MYEAHGVHGGAVRLLLLVPVLLLAADAAAQEGAAADDDRFNARQIERANQKLQQRVARRVSPASRPVARPERATPAAPTVAADERRIWVSGFDTEAVTDGVRVMLRYPVSIGKKTYTGVLGDNVTCLLAEPFPAYDHLAVETARGDVVPLKDAATAVSLPGIRGDPRFFPPPPRGVVARRIERPGDADGTVPLWPLVKPADQPPADPPGEGRF